MWLWGTNRRKYKNIHLFCVWFKEDIDELTGSDDDDYRLVEVDSVWR